MMRLTHANYSPRCSKSTSLVTKVASVGEALEALERLSLDVLVSDIGMPGKTATS